MLVYYAFLIATILIWLVMHILLRKFSISELFVNVDIFALIAIGLLIIFPIHMVDEANKFVDSYTEGRTECIRSLKCDLIMGIEPELAVTKIEEFNNEISTYQAMNQDFLIGWLICDEVDELQPIDIDEYTEEYK